MNTEALSDDAQIIVDSIKVPASDLTDESILQDILQGNINAYGSIMRRYNQKMYRVARSIVSHDASAMDVVQEAHIKAFSKLNSFKRESTFRAWLYAITRNEALMYLRKHERERKMNVIDIDTLDEQKNDSQSDFDIASYEALPESSLASKQLGKFINHYIDRLQEDFRVVFVLRAVEQLSVKEVAEILQVKEDTVKTRYLRAKRLMQKSIQNYLNNSGLKVYEFGGPHCDRVVYNVLKKINPEYQK